jgi:hypothetical protein
MPQPQQGGKRTGTGNDKTKISNCAAEPDDQRI